MTPRSPQCARLDAWTEPESAGARPPEPPVLSFASAPLRGLAGADSSPTLPAGTRRTDAPLHPRRGASRRRRAIRLRRAHPCARPRAAGPDATVIDLAAGWNLVAWTGDDTLVTDALGDVLASIASVHVFDAGRQAFDSFTSAAPAFLNSLDTLPAGAGVWLFADRAVAWAQPGVVTAQSVALVAGFNLLGWTGDDTPVAEAVAQIEEALGAIFLWDTAAERFLSFSPTAPASGC